MVWAVGANSLLLIGRLVRSCIALLVLLWTMLIMLLIATWLSSMPPVLMIGVSTRLRLVKRCVILSVLALVRTGVILALTSLLTWDLGLVAISALSGIWLRHRPCWSMMQRRPAPLGSLLCTCRQCSIMLMLMLVWIAISLGPTSCLVALLGHESIRLMCLWPLWLTVCSILLMRRLGRLLTRLVRLLMLSALVVVMSLLALTLETRSLCILLPMRISILLLLLGLIRF